MYSTPQPTFGAPHPPFGAPPQGFGGPPPFGAPGVAIAPTPRKSKTGLYVIIAVVLVVVIVGAVLFVVLKKGSSSSNNSGASLTTYTSSDGTFSVGYPNGWTKHATTTEGVSGGVEFTGPTNQEVFEVVNFGDSPLSPDAAIGAACGGDGGSQAAGPSPVTISGQQWERIECSNITSGTNGTSVQAVIEAISYKGNLFAIIYGSSQGAFASDQSQYYTPMEQSFKFLS